MGGFFLFYWLYNTCTGGIALGDVISNEARLCRGCLCSQWRVSPVCFCYVLVDCLNSLLLILLSIAPMLFILVRRMLHPVFCFVIVYVCSYFAVVLVSCVVRCLSVVCM